MCIVYTYRMPHNRANRFCLQEKCGLPLSPYFSALKLHWLLQNVDTVKEAKGNNNDIAYLSPHSVGQEIHYHIGAGVVMLDKWKQGGGSAFIFCGTGQDPALQNCGVTLNVVKKYLMMSKKNLCY